MNSDPIARACATYRKAIKIIAAILRVRLKQTSFPSEDFEAVADLIDEKSKERALQWYERGIRRGFIEACDALLDGKLELRDGTLYSPNKVEVSIRFRFHGQPWQRRKFEFRAENLEFE